MLIILLSEKQFYVETKRRMHEKNVKEIKKAENFNLRDITTNARAKAINQTGKKFNIPRIHKFGALVVFQISHTYYD